MTAPLPPITISPRLVDFTCSAIRLAVNPADVAAERVLDSPYSGLTRLEARALIVAANGRESIAEAIENARMPLSAGATQAARRFIESVRSIAAMFRRQGATARELVDEIAVTFALEARLTSRERETLEWIRTSANRFDESSAGGVKWDPGKLIEILASSAAVPQPALSAPRPQPLAHQEKQTPADVRRRHSHFSASSLGMVAECARKWYYRYVCATVEDRGSSASFYGTTFHFALEHFHGQFPRADLAAPDELARSLEGWINTAFEHYRSKFETNLEFELQRRRARRTAKRYVQWFVERSAAHPFTVVGNEIDADFELDGYKFKGYIDRLDRNDADGTVTIVDYKTGTIAESAAEYRDRIARFVDFQLPAYYWARTDAGDRVTRLALVPLKEASVDVRPIELEVVPVAAPPPRGDAPVEIGTIGIDELRLARTRMVELARLLSDQPIEHFAAARDSRPCKYCTYVHACRERPMPNEDRFAR